MKESRELRGVVDLLEEGFAILDLDEYGPLEIPIAALPDGCREGDVLRIVLERQDRETQDRKNRILDLYEELEG